MDSIVSAKHFLNTLVLLIYWHPNFTFVTNILRIKTFIFSNYFDTSGYKLFSLNTGHFVKSASIEKVNINEKNEKAT